MTALHYQNFFRSK